MNVIESSPADAGSQPNRKLLAAILVNALPLALCLYGLKCILTQQGTLTVGSRQVMRSFHFVRVQGAAAELAGLGYMALALFGFLCTGDPPPENRHWTLRVLRGVARWGSLVAMFWFWQRAAQLVTGAAAWPSWRDLQELVMLAPIAMCLGIVLVMAFLLAMFQREAVKRDLFENGCQPLHVWWRPAAYWGPAPASTAFRVVYVDAAGCLHKAYCATYRSFRDSPNWGSRRVRWLRDEVTERASNIEPFVFVDSDPVRRKLEA
jgi:hypothetical protein